MHIEGLSYARQTWNPEAGDHCHCRLLDLYIGKLPPEAIENDLFYVRNMEKVNKRVPTYKQSVSYYSIPNGHNKLSQMVPEMYKLGNISGHKTNHSLQATGATELYEAQVPEKIYRRELATVLWSVCVRMNTPVTNSSELCQISCHLIHSHHIMHRWQSLITVIKKNAGTSTSGPGLVANMKFDNCQVNININHGPSAPVNFTRTGNSVSSLAAVTTESHQTTSELGMPSA